MKEQNKLTQNVVMRDMDIFDMEQILAIGKNEPYFRVNDKDNISSGFWSEEVLRKWITSKNGIPVIAIEKDSIVRFALVTIQPITNKGEFENLWVVPSFRGSGLASEIVNFVIEKVRIIGDVKVLVAFTEEENHTVRNMLIKKYLSQIKENFIG